MLILFILVMSTKQYKLCNASVIREEMPIACFEESDPIAQYTPPPVITPKRVDNRFVFNPVSDFNHRIQFWNKTQILEDMKKGGFVDLDGLDITTLKEIRMAHYYDNLLWDMNEKTGLGIGVIWAFLRIEAYSSGVNESSLMRNGWNFGGIKYRKNIHPGYVFAKDDCGSNKCRFAKFNSYKEGVEAWARVFNAPRYASAKSQKNAIDVFYKLYKGGYHTHNNVKQRKALRDKYWSLRKHFPPNTLHGIEPKILNLVTFPDEDDFYESHETRTLKRAEWKAYIQKNKSHALAAQQKYGVHASWILAEGLISSNCGRGIHFDFNGRTRDAYLAHAKKIGKDYYSNHKLKNKLIHVIEDMEL